MTVRRASVWGFVVLLVSLGVFSFVGSPPIGWLYAGLVVPILVFHWWYACRRCNNVACALNTASNEFFLGRRRRDPEPGFSDLDASRAGVPLVFSVGVGFYGAWGAGPLAFAACVLLLIAAGVPYVRKTCAQCTNDCPANRSVAYADWKRSGSG
jgi:hypothetical protein